MILSAQITTINIKNKNLPLYQLFLLCRHHEKKEERWNNRNSERHHLEDVEHVVDVITHKLSRGRALELLAGNLWGSTVGIVV